MSDDLSPTDDNTVTRRFFLGAAAASAIAAKGSAFHSKGAHASHSSGEQAQVPAFALDEATITDLQNRMRGGTETAHSLAQQYLARIDAIDQRGPSINSVIELNPDALTIATQLDTERKAGTLRVCPAGTIRCGLQAAVVKWFC
jgi:amidase